MMRYIVKTKPTSQFPKTLQKHHKMPIYKQQTIMLGCKMLKTSPPDHQTINVGVNKQLLCLQ
jgi:hypothetical protein